MSHELPPMVRVIFRLFQERGGSEYGGEAVTQLEHALQAAHFARKAGASPALVTAALLHDVGHLLHELPEDAPDQGVDDRHEALAERWLRAGFPPEVVEPVRLHVEAKRYLCAVEPGYHDALSEPSKTSLRLQGGPMSAEEVEAFRALPHFEGAVALRRWDDTAKIPALAVEPLESYLTDVASVAWES